MINSGFTPNRAHVKCSRVVGDVMANFHPHGDSAIYDALVRMAQPFSLRDPLISFHGNYGSPEFGPAAARYTECRLSPLAMHLIDGIDENTVDLTANYDGKNSEPVVLPARFPNLLVNGSQGIAVGMATNIPPHNLGEVIDATIYLIDHPDATPDDLMQFIKGPDFPTGAQILGRSGILDAYRTGRGSVRMRADAEIEESGRGMQIAVTALAYQTSTAAIATRIKELVDARELDGIRDINDESSGDQTRLVIELKRDANPNVVLNNLYKHTQLQTSFGVNMVALVDGVPRTLNLVAMLAAYVAHQVEVIRRRSQYRLDRARARAHILEGRLRALDMIDEFVRRAFKAAGQGLGGIADGQLDARGRVGDAGCRVEVLLVDCRQHLSGGVADPRGGVVGTVLDRVENAVGGFLDARGDEGGLFVEAGKDAARRVIEAVDD